MAKTNPPPPLSDRERVLVWALQCALSFIPSFKRHTDPMLRQCISILREVESDAEITKEPEYENAESAEVINLRDYILTHYGQIREALGDGDGGDKQQ